MEYSESIINTVREPLIVLDQDLRVVSVSRSFYEFFKVKPEETMGQLIYDLGNKQWDIPKLRELLETVLPQQTTFDDYEVEHDFATIGRRIMLLNARQIEQASGKNKIILLAIEDITERRAIEAGLEKTRKELEVIKKSADEAREFAESLINTVREPLISLDQELRVVAVSRSFYEFFKVKPEETMGQLIYDLGNKQWDIPKLRELLETVLPQQTTFDDYEVEHDFATIGRRIMLLNARQIEQASGKERIILLAIEDITERKEIEAGLEKTRKELAVIKKSADEASEFAESIINTVREPLIALDQDLRVVTVSRSFYEFFKVKPEDTVGQLIYDLGNKQWDIPKLRELLETVLPQQTTFDDYEVEHDFATIGRRIMLLNARQIEQASGKERIILLAIEDITERRAIEAGLEKTRKELAVIKKSADEAREFAESIINTVREPLISLDQELRVVAVSRSFYEFFKVKPEETMGQLIYDLGNKQWDIPKLRELLETVLPQQTTFDDYEVEHDFATIGRRIMLLNARQIEQASGKERIILLAIEDITERRAIEDRLEHAKQAAEQAAKAKSDFLANMSHEIRTPLNGIIGLNNLILKTSLTPLQQDYMMKSQQSSNALLSVINDILDYSKIEAGKLEFEEKAFSIETVLRNVSDLFEYAVMKKSLEIHIDIHPDTPQIVRGDSLRLGQVFNNLVGNAVKFTETGDITIRVEPIIQTETHVQLQCSVSDTGIGMSEQEQAKLFQAFSQTDTSNTRKYGGTGLGLTICSQLVELMSGRIWQESVKSKGSIFYFTVELRKDESETASLLNPHYFRDLRFLVVDDNQLERELIGSILSSWGAYPTLCETGKEAIDLAEHHPFDYLIIDWKMPDIDGLDVIKILQEKKLKSTFPKVIMVTAYNKENLLKAAVIRNVQLDKILHKPVTPSVLFKSITETDMIDKLERSTADKCFFAGGKVLVVEDNEINQLVARDLLESFGLDVSMSDNGKDAVEKVKSGSYDLILMDLQMPIMDGFEATRKIREFNRDIPIFALSAAVMEHDKELTIAAGMNDHLAKPINVDELQRLLEHHLKTGWIAEDIVSKNTDELYGINIADLSKKLKQPENIKRFLQLFADEHRDFSIRIMNAPVGSDTYKQLIHTLIGVSGNVSAMIVYDIVKAINESDDENVQKELIPYLIEELNLVVLSIDRRFPKTMIDSQQNTRL